MIKYKLYILLVIALYFFDLQAAPTGFRFKKIDMHNGLSYNSVLCLLQDDKQNIWIGTRDGLNRYNGLDNQIFKQSVKDTHSLSNSHVNCLLQTRNGDIWIGTAYGLNLYSKTSEGRFSCYYPKHNDTAIDQEKHYLSHGYVRSICESKDGQVWVGTSDGLNRLDPKSGAITNYTITSEGTASNNIIALFYDDKARLWVGTSDGLFVKEKEAFIPIRLDHKKHEVRDIKQGRNLQMWIATEDNGIYSFNYNDALVTNQRNFSTSNSALVSNSARKLHLEDSCIWVATLQGVSLLDPNGRISTIEHTNSHPNSISNSSIHDILKDHQGGYWLATYTGGVNYYHAQNNLFPQVPIVTDEVSNLVCEDITALIEDAKKNIWIATNTSGLYYWNVEANVFEHYHQGNTSQLLSNNIKTFSIDNDNNLWIGTYHGLYSFDRCREEWNRYIHESDNINTLNCDQVHAVHADHKGNVWIGMNGGDFQVYNPTLGKFTSIRGIGKYVEAIYEDSRGHIWIGGPKGLNCIDTETQNFIDISKQTTGYSQQLKNINCISEDTEGRLWIGTKGMGLMILNNGKFYDFDERDGLNDNTINAIQEGNDGKIWLSSNKGLTQLSYSKDANHDAQLTCWHYGMIDGLQGKQFEKGSSCKRSDNSLLFGGINGLNIVLTKGLEREVWHPKVKLSDFKINLENLSYPEVLNPSSNHDNQYNLKYNQRNISLDFVGINYIDSEGMYYRYRLNKSNSAWVYLEHQHNLNFIDLSPGNYELEIQASSNNQIWGEDYTLFKFDINPPYWKSWWAYTLYLLAGVLIVFMLFRYYGRMVKLKNSLSLAEYKNEHGKELNESKLRFFTDISHELRTPLTLILGPLEHITNSAKHLDKETLRHLHNMQHNGNRMLRLVNQVLHLRKLDGGYDKLNASDYNIVELLDVIYKEFGDTATENGVVLELHTKLTNPLVWYDVDKMESVLYNLISNAMKNTPTGEKIQLYVKDDAERHDNIIISILNTGKSIPKDDVPHIFERFFSRNDSESSSGVGLELTKRIVELHNGKIWLETEDESSENAAYTKFSVSLPKSRSTFTNKQKTKSTSSTINAHSPVYHEHLEDVPQKTKEKQVPIEKSNDTPTLLIVEDNHDMRQFIKDLLIDSYNIVEATDGLEGWEQCEKIMPDLIISDVMMPNSDGIELCKRVKKGVRTNHIPIILLTAKSGDMHEKEGISSGADDYITKPFSAELLHLRIGNLLKQRQLYHQHFTQQVLLEPETITITTVDDKLLKKAVDYISEHMEKSQISVEKLSQELGLSRVHFYRKIKTLTGMTAVEFIRSIRLKRAAVLLETKSLSVKEIQLKVGFDNADYFRKCFKERYHMPPTEYRDNLKVSE